MRDMKNIVAVAAIAVGALCAAAAKPAAKPAQALGVSADNAAALRAKIAKTCKIEREDVWHGHSRIQFRFKGRMAWVVAPSVAPLDGTPWTWTMQWAEAFVERTGVPALLKSGFHHVTIDLYPTRMDDTGVAAAAEFQDFLVKELGFAPKANLIGMSWGPPRTREASARGSRAGHRTANGARTLVCPSTWPGPSRRPGSRSSCSTAGRTMSCRRTRTAVRSPPHSRPREAR